MKCRFFPVLFTVLMMFFGVSLFAQDYVPGVEALNRVNTELASLKQGLTNTNVSVVNPTSLEADVANSLKIQFATELISNLQKGYVTELSLTNANNTLASRSSNQDYVKALQNAQLYFQNLLK
jgi:hypothetical protein